jgi:type II secretory pathway pseudopilin PulG
MNELKMKNTNHHLVNLDNHNGYMLIEALIAIAIFSIGFLAMATLVFSASRNNENGNLLTQANMLARQTLEELKNTPDLTTLDEDPLPLCEDDGRVDGEGNPGGIFARTCTVEDALGFDTSRAISVTVNWKWRGKNRSIVLKTITKGNGT